jgi:oxygen-independent coproporphyrinogen-3 oxidase
LPNTIGANTPGEFTVEANPESADAAFLASCRECGVNRISVGVQTFHEASRRAVHRVGEGSLLPERLGLIAEYFPESFTADLISGLPFQNEAVLLRDVETLLSFKPAHVSLYALTVEEGTPLRTTLDSQLNGLMPSVEEAENLWLIGRDALESAGYHQYEVSNFALPGKSSRHNIRYWRMENWLALGPGASATVIDDASGTGRRYTVTADVDAWLNRDKNAAQPVTEELLDRLTLMKETLLMGFRYLEGPDPALFKKRFGVSVEAAIPRTMAKWREKGLSQRDTAALTGEGLLFLNAFLVEAFGELDISCTA